MRLWSSNVYCRTFHVPTVYPHPLQWQSHTCMRPPKLPMITKQYNSDASLRSHITKAEHMTERAHNYTCAHASHDSRRRLHSCVL